MEQGLTRRQILNELGRSNHASLQGYLPTCGVAAKEDPEFFAHLISYNKRKGQVRDAEVALPIIGLSQFTDDEFIDNAAAHLALLTPRELVSAFKFAYGYVRQKGVEMGPHPKTGKPVKMRLGGWKRFTDSPVLRASRRRLLDKVVARYLRKREMNSAEFERNLVNFRKDIITLYGLSHTRMSEFARTIIMDKVRPADSALAAIKRMKDMTPIQAAASIVEYGIPFHMLFPIMGEKAKDPVLLMAIIDRMTPSQLQTNMKVLERMGVKDHPETRVALENGLKRMATSRKTTLKTSKAAEAVQDQALKSALREVQEKQIEKVGGPEGNWLILSDASPSMIRSIDFAKDLAGTMARFCKGEVHLVFFDSSPRYYNMTGKTLEEVRHVTRHIRPVGGGTSIGCGLRAVMDKGLDIDGIAIVSDGEENTAPVFADVYGRYRQSTGNDTPVYYFKVDGSGFDTLKQSMDRAGFDTEYQDLRNTSMDSYSMPNLVQQMRVKRYSIIDEVMDSRLLTLDGVLGIEKEELAVCS